MDIIQLLPDSIANQIAAGEVIQRPSSVVKELLENSVDAGASKVSLSIKKAGKQLIQVIDNGQGMSEADARMAFERHATSKIQKADDLFSLHTMGFRGEALASIASIAQVSMLTRKADTELGTRLLIEESRLIEKSKEAMNTGTQILVKNLFFNIPARRKFLKKDTTELKHIIDEFNRVALAFPEVHFQLYNEDRLLQNLEASNSKNRVLGILGKSWDTKLIPIEQDTEYLQLRGFIAKPDKATKSRQNQFFIVNNRFIRSPYLHHALVRAFEGLIDEEMHPSYVLYLDVDPSHLDINVHPTKQEIKFEDESLIYSYVHSAVKHALGRYSITPSLDFDMDRRFDDLEAMNRPVGDSHRESAAHSSFFQTFQKSGEAHRIHPSSSHWDRLVTKPEKSESTGEILTMSEIADRSLFENFYTESQSSSSPENKSNTTFQIDKNYIVTSLRSTLLIIHQARAHTRILYEQLKKNKQQNPASQSLITPQKIQLDAQNSAILEAAREDFEALGFDIRHFGDREFLLHAIPAGMDLQHIEEEVLKLIGHQDLPSSAVDSDFDPLTYRLAQSLSIKTGQPLAHADMEKLIADLFSLPDPNFTPKGEKIIIRLENNNLEEFFK